MQIKIKTETLKTLTSKAVKGMSNNKMLPITEMIGITVVGTNLSLLSTDGTNKVEIKAKIENPENVDFSLAVNGNTFSKLIQKTTTEFTTLILEDDKLTVKGNGSYSFAIPVDEDGNKIVFESLSLEGEQEEVNVESLKNSYLLNKESVATTMEVPAYTGFYYDNSGSVATNSLKISYLKEVIIKNPVLLFTSFVQLFSLIDEKTAKITQTSSEICVSSDSVIIKGPKMTDLSEFPIDSIKPFLDIEMPNEVRVNKQALLNLLDRIAIFVTPYDKNGIKIDFTKDGVRVWTLKGESNELLPYVSVKHQEDFSIKIDVINFKALVSSNPNEEVIIQYGNPNAIKMMFGNSIQIAALQE